VDKAIAMLTSAGLDVVLDIHPEPDFMEALEEGGDAEDRFVAFWAALAKHYKDAPKDTLVYELLNEPQYYKHSDRYNRLVARLMLAIRAQDDGRLVIIGTPGVTDMSPTQLVTALETLDLVDDPNIAYDVHYYLPYIITHQGIHMGFEKTQIRNFREVPYPSSLVDKAKVKLAPEADKDAAMGEVDDYVADNWNRTRINSYIQPAAEWAKAHHVRLFILEFGALRVHIDPESRYRWIEDARSSFEANGIGWALYDYTDIFGITTLRGQTYTDPHDLSVTLAQPETGSREIEAAALKALGLSPAAVK
jgi:endoglucanase